MWSGSDGQAVIRRQKGLARFDVDVIGVCEWVCICVTFIKIICKKGFDYLIRRLGYFLS